MFRRISRFILLLLSWPALIYWAAADEGQYTPLVLISLDGYRWDYADRYPEESATLRKLRSSGASAKALIPVFPSNTFPNHYTMVTGLRPARHGIVNNDMFDPATGAYFRYNNPMSVRNPAWWGGEPVWVTAQKQGRRAACSFWVGSEAAIQGMHPTYWRHFDAKLPFATRLKEFESWLQLPADRRPDVITFYLEDANSAGHRKGPDSPEVRAAVRQLNQYVAELLESASRLGARPNWVIVSDHGMMHVRTDAAVAVDHVLDAGEAQMDFGGPVGGFRPLGDTTVDKLIEKLSASAHRARVVRSEELPAHFHFRGNVRIPPVLVLPEPGGWVERERRLAELRKTTEGEHGYDPMLPDMHGILVVNGPAFETDGRAIEAVENVHVYNLLCAAAGLRPAENDGDDRLVSAFLRAAPTAP
jgi:predicted AlkP superfamily pyrophosphatase or phosphodiesterase